MSPWKTTLLPSAQGNELRFLVTSREGHDLVKAWLPTPPGHPRALLTLLEGLALWTEPPLTAAISVGEAEPPSFDSRLFGDARWPSESALVHFVRVLPWRRRRRIPGVGDFRPLRVA